MQRLLDNDAFLVFVREKVFGDDPNAIYTSKAGSGGDLLCSTRHSRTVRHASFHARGEELSEIVDSVVCRIVKLKCRRACLRVFGRLPFHES